ncbi:MAG: integrase [bacterium]|nr:integrase [bacterium]
MNDDSVVSIAQLREFSKLSQGAKFSSEDVCGAYRWIGRTLGKFRYNQLRKKEKSLVKTYLITMTGYSETQIDRLIHRKKTKGVITKQQRTQPEFERIYTAEDIVLLSEVDNAENRRTGAAVKKTCRDMYYIYKDVRFERLAQISVSHLYNLRGTRVYESRSLTYEKTNPTKVDIGIRAKPKPEGIPGFLRVDSVHQGDSGKEKGVYYINLVDEVTQWEMVVCVEGISELFLIPALKEVLIQHPCHVKNFHSDNGSEYINYVVAELLGKLLIGQTKSRSRRTNDNALVEGKNTIIRRFMGYIHIPRKYAPLINEWCRDFLNPYLNFHRQCAFATDVVDAKGKITKVYKNYMTPCEKLFSIPGIEKCLKPEITKESLRTKMMTKTHLAAAQEMQAAKKKLFDAIRQTMLS